MVVRFLQVTYQLLIDCPVASMTKHLQSWFGSPVVVVETQSMLLVEIFSPLELRISTLMNISRSTMNSYSVNVGNFARTNEFIVRGLGMA